MNGVTVYVTKEDWNVNLEPKLYMKYYLDGQIESINSAAADTDYSVLGMTLAKEDFLLLFPHPRHTYPSPSSHFSHLFTVILLYVFL